MQLNNTKNKKIYCSHGFTSYANWIVNLDGFELTHKRDEADILLFAGGKDIDTKFYGEQKGKYTDSRNQRDVVEFGDFQYGLTNKLPIVGICRGAQLACALSGGKLIQHVTNHQCYHKMETKDGITMTINSLHHQMLNPFVMDKSNYDILGWAKKNLSTTYLNGHNKETSLPLTFVEPEIVYFPKTKSLAYQYHPEMMFNGPENETINYTQQIFLKFINNQL